MAKRGRKVVRALVKPGEGAAPLDYGALVAAIGQAHQTAQSHAVQDLPLELRGRHSPTTREELSTILSHGCPVQAGAP